MKRTHITVGHVGQDGEVVANDHAWASILEEARHRPLGTVVVTLGEKAEEDGQYASGKEFTVEKIPGRIFIIKPKP